MKYVFSISLLLIYLVGSIQSSWVIIDFYWNRDDYTQRYCRYLDEGITQCRASCYLENLIENQQENQLDANIITSRKIKIAEFIICSKIEFTTHFNIHKHHSNYIFDQYHFEYLQFIFHPPKV